MRARLNRRLWRPWPTLAASVVLAACGGEAADKGLACVALPDEVSWFRGSASNDWNDVLIDAKQRVWLAGYADGTLGAGAVDPGGNSRAVVRQLAPDGRVLWDSAALFDTPSTDVAEALAITGQGMVVAGRTTGVLAGGINAGQFDTFVALGDLAPGAAPWTLFQTGNAAPQRPLRVAATAAGEIIVAGQDDLFVPTNHVQAWPDPFVLRLHRKPGGGTAAPLQLRWQHQYGSPSTELTWGLAVPAETVAGSGATYFSFTVSSGSGSGMHVRKLNADGQVLWTERYSALGLDNIVALRPLPDGSLWMAGTVNGPFDGNAGHGMSDVFLARIDGDSGRVLHSWQFGTADAEGLTDMAIDARGNFMLFGETLGSWVAGQPSAGQTDLFLMQVSPSGQRLAVRQWGTAADEAARRVAVDACGNALAVASSTTNGQRAGLLWYWRP